MAFQRALQYKKELSSLMAELTTYTLQYTATRFENIWVSDDAFQLACYIITAENPDAAAAQRYSDFVAENPMPERNTAGVMNKSIMEVLDQRVREMIAITALTKMPYM